MKNFKPRLVRFISFGKKIILEKENSDGIPLREKIMSQKYQDECKLI